MPRTLRFKLCNILRYRLLCRLKLFFLTYLQQAENRKLNIVTFAVLYEMCLGRRDWYNVMEVMDLYGQMSV